ncbi:MAG: DUF1178 family protein [Alphaproteobacteria bacterium]
MIRYGLVCTNHHEFDGWFRDSAGFENQIAQAEIPCPVCGTSDVAKALMTPGVPRKATQKRDPGEVATALRALRRQVEANADNVGNNFAQEARRIYYREAEERGIYGKATLQEARDLNDEGIEVLPLPSLPEDQN